MKNNPFEGLRQKLGLPDTPSEPPELPPSDPQAPTSGLPHPTLGLRDRTSEPRSRTSGPPNPGTSGPARAVVRYERSGRGGKEVTVVEQLALDQADLESWLKALKSSLGCGGKVEGDAIMLQGDHRKRVPALLTQRGVRKVIVS